MPAPPAAPPWGGRPKSDAAPASDEIGFRRSASDSYIRQNYDEEEDANGEDSAEVPAPSGGSSPSPRGFFATLSPRSTSRRRMRHTDDLSDEEDNYHERASLTLLGGAPRKAVVGFDGILNDDDAPEDTDGVTPFSKGYQRQGSPLSAASPSRSPTGSPRSVGRKETRERTRVRRFDSASCVSSAGTSRVSLNALAAASAVPPNLETAPSLATILRHAGTSSRNTGGDSSVGTSPVVAALPGDPSSDRMGPLSSIVSLVQVQMDFATAFVAWCNSAPSKTTKRLTKLQERIERDEDGKPVQWIETNRASMFWGALILLNAIFIGVDLEVSARVDETPMVMTVTESLFLVLFWIEIVLRIRSRGFARFFRDRWGPFDVLCTLLGSIDAWILSPFLAGTVSIGGLSALRILRLLRMLRLVRALRAFKELSSLVTALGKAFSATGFLCTFSMLIVYASACLLLISLGDRIYLSEAAVDILGHGLFWACYQHMTIVTGEGFIDMWILPAEEISAIWPPVWRLYFVLAVFVLNDLLLELMVALIIQKSMGDGAEEQEERAVFARESKQLRRTLGVIFRALDVDRDGMLSCEDMERLLSEDELREALHSFNIRTDVPREYFLAMLGYSDETPKIEIPELIDACIRVCATSGNIRAFMLQLDVFRVKKQLAASIDRVESQLSDIYARSLAVSRKNRMRRGSSPEIDLSLPWPSHAEMPASSSLQRKGGAEVRRSPRSQSPIREAFATDPGSSLYESPRRSRTLPAPAAPPAPPADDSSGGPPSWPGGDGSPTPVLGVKAFVSSALAAAQSVTGFGRGGGDRFDALLAKARDRLDALERQQDSMLLELSEVRFRIFGTRRSVCVRCSEGHPLVPMGSTSRPTGVAAYSRWACDATRAPGGCKFGKKPATHTSSLQRFHCPLCHYDICELCYRARLKRIAVPRASRETWDSSPEVL